MTSFDEREQAFEKKFALEQERIFLARAHAAKVLGEWAAALLGLTGEETAGYIESVLALNVGGSNTSVVFDKVRRDLEGHGVNVGIEELHRVWEKARADGMTTGAR